MPKRRKSYAGYFAKSNAMRCHYCSRRFGNKPHNRRTADHVKPLSAGGYDKRKNVVAACYSCNQRKRSMSAGEFMELLRTEAEAR